MPRALRASVKRVMAPATLRLVRTHRIMLVLGAAAVVAAGGDCPKGGRTYSAPKDPAPAQVASASSSSAEGRGDIHFTAPPEWKPLGATGMSVATYRVA